MSKRLFNLGQIVATPAALELLGEAQHDANAIFGKACALGILGIFAMKTKKPTTKPFGMKNGFCRPTKLARQTVYG